MKVSNVDLHEMMPDNEKDFSLRITSSRYPITHTHWHEHLEIKYFVSEKGTATVNNNTYIINHGDIIIANPYDTHEYTTTDGLDNIIVIFYPNFFYGTDFNKVILHNHISNDTYLQEKLKSMFYLSKKNDLTSKLEAKSLAYEVVCYLINNYTDSILTEQEYANKLHFFKKISIAIDYIDHHYAEHITLEDLCRTTYTSKGYFCKIFKSATGKTPMEYINDYRLNKAIPKLQETNDSITFIAASVGFNDVNYFCRLFKKNFSKSPNKYREL